MSDGFVSTEFRITVRNVGGSGGSDSEPVLMAINEDSPEQASEIGRPGSGDMITFVVTRDMDLGMHTVGFEIGDARHEINVDVKAANLILEPLRHKVTGDGSIDLPVKVTNLGDLHAAAISVFATWVAVPTDSEGGSEPQHSSVGIEALAPGESLVADLPIDVPTGAHTITLGAETESIEVQQDNNSAESLVEVDYVQLVSSIESTDIVGYERDGYGVVEVALKARNGGVAESGPIGLGLTCVDEEIEACSWETNVDSILPGTSTTVFATLRLPQGLTVVDTFAGENDDGYRWGAANVRRHIITVPEKPSVSLALNADAKVGGYWSDGTANVELTMLLLNDGYSEVEGPQSISIGCLRDGEVLGDCGLEAHIDLADGFGPATSTVTVRAPMGSSLHVGGEEGEPLWFDVPERILGVNRDVWECFSDRPGEFEGCGGWSNRLIHRWKQDSPVKVWAYGDPYYIEMVTDLLDEYSPLLNLEFEMVDSKEDSYVEAYVGVPRSEADAIGWANCTQYLGCGPSHTTNEGFVYSGAIIVWPSDGTRRGNMGVVLHELLHVLVPVGHRTKVLGAVMGREGKVSSFEEAMLRLNSHPLIEVGMSIPEVRDLIIFKDELLDRQVPNPHERAWHFLLSAERTLKETNAVRFSMRGGWTGECHPRKFGPAIYEIGGIAIDNAGYHFGEGLVRYEDRGYHFLRVEGSYWQEIRRKWTEIDKWSFFWTLGWNHQDTSPLRPIHLLLGAPSGVGITISESSDGLITLEAEIPYELPSGKISLTMTKDTYQITSYKTRTKLYGSEDCYQTTEAWDGEYGIEIEVPEAIRNAEADT